MMRIRLDPIGGIAGDMFVAAALDAFPHLWDAVRADLAAVLPPEAGEPVFGQRNSGAFAARSFGLDAIPQERHHRGHHRDHLETTYAAMLARISDAGLEAGVTEAASALLTILGKAEAAVHGIPLEKVHFHEIADWDSLMDVVAAGSIAARLDAEWSVSALPSGGGTIRTQHGLLPLPAPATIEILKGFEWRDDGVPGERVTPTGAAILRYLVDPERRFAGGRLISAGAGAGTRALPAIPNILRLLAFETDAVASSDRVVCISFEVDDMTGEEIGTACERLRAKAGVLDVSVAPWLGKKGRPAQAFRLLVAPAAVDSVADRCFAETSTIGLRLREEKRVVLPRRHSAAAAIRTKTVTRPDGAVTAKAENDHLAGATLAARRAEKHEAESHVEHERETAPKPVRP